MAGIVYACITPHGSEVIPELAAIGAAGGGTPVGAPAAVGGPDSLGPALAGFARLTAAMEAIGRRARLAAPETIVVATPHNLRLDGGFTAVVTSEFTSGTLTAQVPGRVSATVEAAFPCDRDLAAVIVDRARAAGVPIVGVNYGAADGQNSLIPLDWGALIPLHFLARPAAGGGSGGVGGGTPGGAPGGATPAVVLIGPSRDVPREKLVTLGGCVAEAAASSGKRVAFVASSDHGHAHLAGGPYGYDPASAAYDKLVCDLVRENRLEDLLSVDPALAEAGKPDSLWQMLILWGVLRQLAAVGRPFGGEFLAYEVPTYFGMLCASYEPVKGK